RNRRRRRVVIIARTSSTRGGLTSRIACILGIGCGTMVILICLGCRVSMRAVEILCKRLELQQLVLALHQKCTRSRSRCRGRGFRICSSTRDEMKSRKPACRQIALNLVHDSREKCQDNRVENWCRMATGTRGNRRSRQQRGSRGRGGGRR